MRCNLVSPSLLTDQHLIAEKRELRMIPPLLKTKLKKGGLKNVLDSIPEEFVLGSGHMSWCLDKGLFLEKRYIEIEREMELRRFVPNPELVFNTDNFLLYKEELYKDFIPSEKDIRLISSRLKEKILLRLKWYKFYGKPLLKDFWIFNL